VTSLRLAAETAVIVGLAQKLIQLLLTRDPLRERVHLSKAGAIAVAAGAASWIVARRVLSQPRSDAAEKGDDR
jgi:hydroxysqualene synthase